MPRMLPTVSPEDLMQAGRIAVIRIARRFDPSIGIPFGGYLQQRLRGTMMDLLETEYARFYSAPRDGQWDPSLARRVVTRPEAFDSRTNPEKQDTEQRGSDDCSNQVPDPNAPTPEASAAASKMAALLVKASEVLSDRERTIVAALFVHGLTLEDAGKLVGLGESRVCQIRAEILGKLKARLRSLGVTEFYDSLA